MSTQEIIDQVMTLGPADVGRVKSALTEREAEIEACRESERRFSEMERGLNVMSQEEFDASLEQLKERINARR